MFVVDASVWVANYHTQDRHHAESQLWLRDVIARGETILGPTILLAEVAGVISRLSGNTASALATIDAIAQMPEFELVVDTEDLAHLSAQVAAELRLRGADAVYVAVAIQRGVPLITLDEQQRVRAGQRVQTARPVSSEPR